MPRVPVTNAPPLEPIRPWRIALRVGRPGTDVFKMAEVKHAGGTEQIRDRLYLVMVFDGQGLIVDAARGATRLVPLDDGGAEGEARHSALLDSARAAADDAGVPVVYVLDHGDWRPGDPIKMPE